MNDRKKWFKERKTYLGGSDIGCILGLNKYRSALDIYLSKTTDVNEEATSEAAHWGNVLEDVIAQEYSRRTGYNVYESQGVIRHPQYSFIGANIDRWVDGSDGKKHILECKTAGFLKSKEWGEQGTDQIPTTYLYQVAYYAAICNVEKVDVAVLIGGQEFRIYTYKKNIEIENKLILAACAFWNNYVAKGIAPETSSVGDINNLYPESNGRVIEADDQILHEIEDLKTLKIQEKEIAKLKIDKEAKIKSCMGDNEAIINQDGELLATWKNGKARKVLDVKRLQAEYQNLCQQYLMEKMGNRTLLIK